MMEPGMMPPGMIPGAAPGPAVRTPRREAVRTPAPTATQDKDKTKIKLRRDLKRTELVVFQPPVFAAEIRMDLIEFRPPPKEEN